MTGTSCRTPRYVSARYQLSSSSACALTSAPFALFLRYFPSVTSRPLPALHPLTLIPFAASRAGRHQILHRRGPSLPFCFFLPPVISLTLALPHRLTAIPSGVVAAVPPQQPLLEGVSYLFRTSTQCCTGISDPHAPSLLLLTPGLLHHSADLRPLRHPPSRQGHGPLAI